MTLKTKNELAKKMGHFEFSQAELDPDVWPSPKTASF